MISVTRKMISPATTCATWRGTPKFRVSPPSPPSDRRRSRAQPPRPRPTTGSKAPPATGRYCQQARDQQDYGERDVDVGRDGGHAQVLGIRIDMSAVSPTACDTVSGRADDELADRAATDNAWRHSLTWGEGLRKFLDVRQARQGELGVAAFQLSRRRQECAGKSELLRLLQPRRHLRRGSNGARQADLAEIDRVGRNGRTRARRQQG